MDSVGGVTRSSLKIRVANSSGGHRCGQTRKQQKLRIDRFAVVKMMKWH